MLTMLARLRLKKNWIEGVTFTIHFFPLYWQENASSTTASEIITGIVSQSLVAYASCL
jgi:hypothetical protein